jgi:predicted DNA-binding protein YlxM (UPF0122 family)
MTKNVYGDQCMSQTGCHEWFKRFMDSWLSTHDEPRLGRPTMSYDDTHVVQVCEIMHSNPHLTVREIAEERNISIGSCHDILTTKLEMHRVVSKFVPRLLTLDQRESRIAICQELLDRTSEVENFLKRNITSDETWVYGHDVETKMQSSQWVGKNLPRPKKAWWVRSNMKVMLTVFF